MRAAVRAQNNPDLITRRNLGASGMDSNLGGGAGGDSPVSPKRAHFQKTPKVITNKSGSHPNAPKPGSEVVKFQPQTKSSSGVINPKVLTDVDIQPGKTSGGKNITVSGSNKNPLPTKSSTQNLKSMKPSDLVRKVSNAQSKLNKMNKIRSTTRKFSRLRGLSRVLAPIGAGLEGMDEFSRKKAQGKGNLEAGLAGLTRAAGGFVGSTLAAVPTAAVTKNPWATAAAGTAGWMGGADAATAAFDYGSKVVKGKKTFKDFNKDIQKTQLGKWWKTAGN